MATSRMIPLQLLTKHLIWRLHLTFKTKLYQDEATSTFPHHTKYTVNIYFIYGVKLTPTRWGEVTVSGEVRILG